MRTSVTLPHSTDASVGVVVRRAQSLVDGIYPTTQLICQGMGYGQPVETQFYYRLTPASHALAGALQSSIHKAVAAAAAATCPAGSGSCKMDGETVRIAHSTVDDLLADEYDKSDGAYAVYILNPQVGMYFSHSHPFIIIRAAAPHLTPQLDTHPRRARFFPHRRRSGHTCTSTWRRTTRARTRTRTPGARARCGWGGGGTCGWTSRPLPPPGVRTRRGPVSCCRPRYPGYAPSVTHPLSLTHTHVTVCLRRRSSKGT